LVDLTWNDLTARSCGVLFAVISAMALLGLNNTDLIDFIKPSQAAAA